jgi:NAD(P)-dependent dehydrogenase (short-subunit alcohol dehydrogenase family)
MRIVMITGCSTGIGLVAAQHLARRGNRVYATARQPDRSSGLQAALAAEPNLRTLPLDVTDEASVATAVETILAREGHIDALVNNAGIGTFGTIEFAPEAELRATFETNFWGVIRVTRAVLPSMRARRSGVIVNITSVAGRLAGPAMGVYPATKYALEAASEALAREVYSLGIRVAIVEPGFVVTPILDKALDTLHLSEQSPYADVERRVHMMFTNAKQVGSDPQVIAEVIEEAIVSNASRLRYPAGADAAVMMSARARMSDEDWIALGRTMSDEEYFGEMTKFFTPPA